MKTVVSILVLTLAMGCPASAQQDARKPDFSYIKCEEWQRNADGSWSTIKPIIIGNNNVASLSFKGGAEVKYLNDKCRV